MTDDRSFIDIVPFLMSVVPLEKFFRELPNIQKLSIKRAFSNGT
jgi:hypothetical protein